jgi:hypothetical protein
MFRLNSANGEGDGENNRKERFHGTKVSLPTSCMRLPIDLVSSFLVSWLLTATPSLNKISTSLCGELAHEWPTPVPQTPSAFH